MDFQFHWVSFINFKPGLIGWYDFLSVIQGAELSFVQVCRHPVTGEQKREIITHIHPSDTRPPGDGNSTLNIGGGVECHAVI